MSEGGAEGLAICWRGQAGSGNGKEIPRDDLGRSGRQAEKPTAPHERTGQQSQRSRRLVEEAIQEPLWGISFQKLSGSLDIAFAEAGLLCLGVEKCVLLLPASSTCVSSKIILFLLLVWSVKASKNCPWLDLQVQLGSWAKRPSRWDPWRSVVHFSKDKRLKGRCPWLAGNCATQLVNGRETQELFLYLYCSSFLYL